MSFLLWYHVRGKHMSNRVRDKMIYYRLYEKLYAYTVSARHVRARCHVRNLSADFVRHDQFSAFLVSPPFVAQSGGCVRQFGIDRCCSLIFPHLELRPGPYSSIWPNIALAWKTCWWRLRSHQRSENYWSTPVLPLQRWRIHFCHIDCCAKPPNLKKEPPPANVWKKHMFYLARTYALISHL